MVGLGIFLMVVGAVVFLLVHTKVLESGGLPLRLIALAAAAIGAVLLLSSLYLNYTPLFYWLALVIGLALVGLSYYLENKKLLWPGVGLLVAGIVMVVTKPGWFLVLALAGLVVLVYERYFHDERVKNAVDSVIQQVK